MSRLNPKWIVGKTVERIDMNPMADGRGGTATDPRIVFTDGSSITFITQETEHGAYGVEVIYTPRIRILKTKKAKPAEAPRISPLAPAMVAKLFEQLPTSMRVRLVGDATTPYDQLSPEVREHAYRYLLGRVGPDR